MSHRKSAQAARDLKLIYKYTYLNFGELQAEKYLYELDAVFVLIGDQPGMGRPFLGQTRQFVHGKHIIVYRLETGQVVIGRIFHGAQRR